MGVRNLTFFFVLNVLTYGRLQGQVSNLTSVLYADKGHPKLYRGASATWRQESKLVETRRSQVNYATKYAYMKLFSLRDYSV